MVVYNVGAAQQASNVHSVSIDATAGLIESYSDNLGPMQSNIINLVNRRIKTDSTVMANIANEGDSVNGGWPMLTAARVNDMDGGCTFVITNLHPSAAMVTTFSLSFVVFNGQQ